MSVCRLCSKDHQFTDGKCVPNQPMSEVSRAFATLAAVLEAAPPEALALKPSLMRKAQSAWRTPADEAASRKRTGTVKVTRSAVKPAKGMTLAALTKFAERFDPTKATDPVTHSGNALTPAQKQRAYRERNAEKVRTANAERMRLKRAKA